MEAGLQEVGTACPATAVDRHALETPSNIARPCKPCGQPGPAGLTWKIQHAALTTTHVRTQALPEENGIACRMQEARAAAAAAAAAAARGQPGEHKQEAMH
eukprot:GHRQ01039129.1.p3 GENE.GHRQ01039129.1~~GHRQ01039129.1.p3  ORF type:complete len:101 (+),score=25.66 GHRQ01039129.1:210-512(+)